MACFVSCAQVFFIHPVNICTICVLGGVPPHLCCDMCQLLLQVFACQGGVLQEEFLLCLLGLPLHPALGPVNPGGEGVAQVAPVEVLLIGLSLALVQTDGTALCNLPLTDLACDLSHVGGGQGFPTQGKGGQGKPLVLGGGSRQAFDCAGW